MAANLVCLCRWHHRAKTDHVWNVTMDPDGVQHWTGPHGQTLHTVPTGMPPNRETAHGAPPGTAGPVLPPNPTTLTRIVAPNDEPPDDHPPDRFTPDGHWADDPCTSADLDALEDLFDGDMRRRARARAGVTAAPTQHPTPRPPPGDTAVDLDDEPPPF